LWAASAVGIFAAAGCDRPDFKTDLVPEGPPDVMAVAVFAAEPAVTMADGTPLCPGAPFEPPPCETAIFCPSDTERDPVKINRRYCPVGAQLTPVTSVDPLSGWVRIAFDELLDPDIEVLTDKVIETGETIQVGSIVAADPVTVVCAGDEVDYTGHYDPSGNAFSAPVGPALVVFPTPPIRSGGECQVTLQATIVDKDGNEVPDDQRGPYTWTVAQLALAATDPENGAEGIVPSAEFAISLTFNNFIDAASLAGNVTLTETQGGAAVALTFAVANESVTATPAAVLTANTSYTLTVAAGIKDEAGGEFMPAEPAVVTFTTGDAPPAP
jgi:hypothetical protein